jgi:hypothetical protein
MEEEEEEAKREFPSLFSLSLPGQGATVCSCCLSACLSVVFSFSFFFLSFFFRLIL